MSGFTKQKIPIIGGIFHKFPIYHRESHLINLMGYQLVRILLFRTKRFFRALSKGAKSSQLDGKGYYSQDNCLSPELFAEIQKYIKELRVKAKGRECYPDSSGDFSFHHRGEFEHHGERFLLLINYRRTENSVLRNFLNK